MAVESTTHTAHLEKSLGLRGVMLLGLAYMAPIIVLGIFGVIAETSQGASAGAYLRGYGRDALHGLELRANGLPLPGRRIVVYVRPQVAGRAGSGS